MIKNIFDELTKNEAEENDKIKILSESLNSNKSNIFDTLKPANSAETNFKYEVPKDSFSKTAKPAETSAGGVLDAMDLSDSFRDLYLELLKTSGLSVNEIREIPAFTEDETLIMMLRTLVRQGNLERFEDDGVVKYRAVAGKREGRKVSSDIWDALS